MNHSDQRAKGIARLARCMNKTTKKVTDTAAALCHNLASLGADTRRPNAIDTAAALCHNLASLGADIRRPNHVGLRGFEPLRPSRLWGPRAMFT